MALCKFQIFNKKICLQSKLFMEAADYHFHSYALFPVFACHQNLPLIYENRFRLLESKRKHLQKS